MKASKAKKDRVNNQDEVQARLEAYGERFMALFEAGEGKNLKKDVSANEPNSVDGEVKTDSSGQKANLESLPKPKKDATELDSDMSFLDKGKNDLIRKRTNASAIAPANLEGNPKAEGWKEARKQFMSSRADKILGISADTARSKGKKTMKMSSSNEGNQTLSKEEFDKVKREVQLFGASALDKRSKKKFDSALLAQLGSRPDKGMKIPASIAIGMAKKRKKREALAFEEAVEAGMVKRKGSGKRKRLQKATGIDRGLMEDGGAFKSGVLKLNRNPLLRKAKK